MPGNPYDGHTLATVIPEIETQIGANLSRIVADRGYRGHNAPPDRAFKVYISGQRRRVTEAIKRQLRRRSAIEPVFGHAKAEHRMGRNYLAGAHGDGANAVLAAAGYNFRRPPRMAGRLLARAFVMAILAAVRDDPIPARLPSRFIKNAPPLQTPRSSRATGARSANFAGACNAKPSKEVPSAVNSLVASARESPNPREEIRRRYSVLRCAHEPRSRGDNRRSHRWGQVFPRPS